MANTSNNQTMAMQTLASIGSASSAVAATGQTTSHSTSSSPQAGASSRPSSPSTGTVGSASSGAASGISTQGASGSRRPQRSCWTTTWPGFKSVINFVSKQITAARLALIVAVIALVVAWYGYNITIYTTCLDQKDVRISVLSLIVCMLRSTSNCSKAESVKDS